MEKNWTVYILQCGDGTLYTGITDDMQRRLRAHESGKGAKYTRGRGPLKLCYQEILPDKGTALRREAELKRLRRSVKLDMIHKFEAENEKVLQNMHDGSILELVQDVSKICHEEESQE